MGRSGNDDGCRGFRWVGGVAVALLLAVGIGGCDILAPDIDLAGRWEIATLEGEPPPLVVELPQCTWTWVNWEFVFSEPDIWESQMTQTFEGEDCGGFQGTYQSPAAGSYERNWGTVKLQATAERGSTTFKIRDGGLEWETEEMATGEPIHVRLERVEETSGD